MLWWKRNWKRSAFRVLEARVTTFAQMRLSTFAYFVLNMCRKIICGIHTTQLRCGNFSLCLRFASRNTTQQWREIELEGIHFYYFMCSYALLEIFQTRWNVDGMMFEGDFFVGYNATTHVLVKKEKVHLWWLFLPVSLLIWLPWELPEITHNEWDGDK